MFKVKVSVLPVYGEKGKGYLVSGEGESAYHPSYDVALALLREALVVNCNRLGWNEEICLV